MRRIVPAALSLILAGNVWSAEKKPLARKLGSITRTVTEQTISEASKVGAVVKNDTPAVGRAVVNGATTTLHFAAAQAPTVRRSAKTFVQWCRDTIKEFWRGFEKK